MLRSVVDAGTDQLLELVLKLEMNFASEDVIGPYIPTIWSSEKSTKVVGSISINHLP